MCRSVRAKLVVSIRVNVGVLVDVGRVSKHYGIVRATMDGKRGAYFVSWSELEEGIVSFHNGGYLIGGQTLCSRPRLVYRRDDLSKLSQIGL